MWLFLLVSISPVVSLHFLAHTCCQICDAAYIPIFFVQIIATYCRWNSNKRMDNQGAQCFRHHFSNPKSVLLQHGSPWISSTFHLHLSNPICVPLFHLNPHVPAFSPKFPHGFPTVSPCFPHFSRWTPWFRRQDLATLRCKQHRQADAAELLEELAQKAPPHPATFINLGTVTGHGWKK